MGHFHVRFTKDIITFELHDVHTAIINALTESAAENVDVDQKVKSTQDVLKSLIG
ncbi:bacterial extracellular solute-binding protein [Streptococcus pneumoniae]|nr:bacterial extracellular solute-binding protein [Streptococcus pneumoniae]